MKHHRVQSTWIDSVAYDPTTKTLEIKYRKSGIRRYNNVPKDVHRDMMEADSIGAFYSRHIKGHYDSEPI